MSSEMVLYESRNRVAYVTLNRPEKLNALNREACAGLAAAWQRLEEGEDRVAVLTGAGRAFCADLAETDLSPSYIPGIHVPLSKPVICAVNGLCVGGGFSLVHFADLAVAAEEAWFSYPEPRLGLEDGLIASLAARIPHKVAMEFMLCSERLDAARAYGIGLVNKVVPGAKLMETADAYAERIAESAPLVVTGLKRAVSEILPRGPGEWGVVARQLSDRTIKSRDYQEGTQAWAEKRPPRFTGE